MKRLALVFLFACNSTSTTPPTPAPTTTASGPASPVASASASAPAPATATACTKDDECSTMSSYCGDLPCACVPYLTAAGAPKCNQPNSVKCFVDPCLKKAAACQQGKCVVTSGGATQ